MKQPDVVVLKLGMVLSAGNDGLHVSELNRAETLQMEWDVGLSLLSKVSLQAGHVLFSLEQSCLPTGLPGWEQPTLK